MIPVEYNNIKAQIHILDVSNTSACNNATISDMSCEKHEIEMLDSLFNMLRRYIIDED